MALSPFPLLLHRNWVRENGVIVTAEDQAGDLSPAEIVSRSPQDFWRSARAEAAGVTKWLEIDLGQPREINGCVLRWDRESIVPAPTDTIRLRLYSSAVPGGLLTAGGTFSDDAWTRFRIDVEPNAIPAPDGVLFADRLIITTGITGQYYVRQPATVTPGTTYTGSIRLRAGAIDWVRVRLSLGGVEDRYFSLSTGEVGVAQESTLDGTVIHQPVSMGGGWWQFALTGEASSTFGSLRVDAANGNGQSTVPAAPGKDFYASGAQLVEGALVLAGVVHDSGAVASDVDPLRGVWSHLLDEPVTAQIARLDLSFANEREVELGQAILGEFYQFDRNVAWESALAVEDNGMLRFGPSARTEASEGKAYWTLEAVLPRLDAADRRAWEEADYFARKTGQLAFVGDPSDANRSTIVGCRPDGAAPTRRRNLAFGEKVVAIREDV